MTQKIFTQKGDLEGRTTVVEDSFTAHAGNTVVDVKHLTDTEKTALAGIDQPLSSTDHAQFARLTIRDNELLLLGGNTLNADNADAYFSVKRLSATTHAITAITQQIDIGGTPNTLVDKWEVASHGLITGSFFQATGTTSNNGYYLVTSTGVGVFQTSRAFNPATNQSAEGIIAIDTSAILSWDESAERFVLKDRQGNLLGLEVTSIVTSSISSDGVTTGLSISGTTVTGTTFAVNQVRAKDSSGLELFDDGGTKGLTISDTGDSVFSESLTVTGNLIVNGSQIVSNVETLTVQDNLILLNSGEVSPTGITAGYAGIDVDRGETAPYRWGFNENSDAFELGEYYEIATGTISGTFNLHELVVQTSTGGFRAKGYVFKTDDSTYLWLKGVTGTFNTDTITGDDSGATLTTPIMSSVDSLQAIATREDTPTNNGLAFWDTSTVKFETDSNLVWDGSATTKLTITMTGNSEGIAVGRTFIGNHAYTDFAVFAHSTFSGSLATSYCLSQESDGSTYLNASGGRSISFLIAHQIKLSINSSGTFTSSVATGIVPITVSSTTKCTNLNADQVDGADLSTNTSLGTSDVLIPSQNAVKTYVDTLSTSYGITALTFTSSVTTGTAPVQVTSTTKCTNLNADQVDGADLSTSTSLGTSDVLIPSQNAVKTYVDTNAALSTNVVLRDGTQGLTAAWDAGSYGITALTLAADTTTAGAGGTFGSAFVGNWIADAPVAAFVHKDLKANEDDYALFQEADGYTALNSKAGKPLEFFQGMSTRLEFDANSNMRIPSTSDSYLFYTKYATNQVAIGSNNPDALFDVDGESRASYFTSDVVTGTAPLTVASTTVVPNLNVDQVDGADLSTSTGLGNSDILIPSQNAVKTYIDTASALSEQVQNSRFRGALVSGNQNITKETWEAAELDDVSTHGYDPLGKWNGSSFYWEVPYTGVYHIIAKGDVAVVEAGVVAYFAIFVDYGAGQKERLTTHENNMTAASLRNLAETVTGHLKLTVGDKVYFKVIHYSSTDKDLTADTKGNTTYMSIQCVAITA